MYIYLTAPNGQRIGMNLEQAALPGQLSPPHSNSPPQNEPPKNEVGPCLGSRSVSPLNSKDYAWNEEWNRQSPFQTINERHLSEDKQRKAQIENQIKTTANRIRPNAIELLFDVHFMMKETAARDLNLKDKEKYKIYLSQLYADIGCLETLFNDSNMNLKDLSRTEKISQSSKALKSDNAIFLQKHQEHFSKIKTKSHQIIVHLAMHYLVLLSVLKPC